MALREASLRVLTPRPQVWGVEEGERGLRTRCRREEIRGKGEEWNTQIRVVEFEADVGEGEGGGEKELRNEER